MSCDPRGHLWKAFFSYCGLCHADDILPPCKTFPQARELAMERGWQHTPKHGWLCPECLKNEKTGAEHGGGGKDQAG